MFTATWSRASSAIAPCSSGKPDRLVAVGTLLLLFGVGVAGAAEFEKPVRLEAGGEPVSVESPGYAAPCWADIDGDGDKDLLVGQFSKGKIKVYKNDGQGNLATGEWLMAGGEVAEVPGVW